MTTEMSTLKQISMSFAHSHHILEVKRGGTQQYDRAYDRASLLDTLLTF